MEDMSIGIATKDQCIVGMYKHLANLEGQISKLDLELDEAKRIVKDAFILSFDEVMKQAKHFFVDKGLNFDLLVTFEFLEDMINQDGQMVEPNQTR